MQKGEKMNKILINWGNVIGLSVGYYEEIKKEKKG